MTDRTQKQRTNRVFKSLHKPLTYLGVERTLFYFVCVGAVGTFNLFNSILAGIAVFIGGFAFGHWVTNSDPSPTVVTFDSLYRSGQLEHFRLS
jgi:Type IV secretory pathway, VirB3-like protein